MKRNMSGRAGIIWSRTRKATRCVSSRGDDIIVSAVAKRFGIPLAAVRDLVSLEIEQLRDRDREGDRIPPNQMVPAEFQRHELGAAKIASFNSEVEESYVSFLDEFDSALLVTAEHEAGIRRHPTFQKYVEMSRAGHEPPYIYVTSGDREGVYVSTNRRRTLTAQELGKRIRGWHSVINAETNLPLKYGDVIRAYQAEKTVRQTQSGH
ncbi:hypothetical protein [Paraburkholderia sp. SIMBA_054]|uniref:hypothetical protein n=1 Tax=Paraburkholderia sp. SIMBA_054 TaxID=3085795 RepID=UPI00397A406C